MMPKEISSAIAKVMATVGYVQKKGVNNFHNYKFAAIGDLLAKIQPAMVDAGLVIMQSEVGHELIADGTVMTATYEFTLAHTSGEQCDWKLHHTGMAGARNSKGGFDDKALNKCHTAARKYFLLGLFQIPTGDVADPDEEEDKPKPANGNGNGHTDSLPPLQRPKAGNSDGLAAASKWAQDAEATVRTFTKHTDLRVWEKDNQKAIQKLMDVDRDLGRHLVGIVADRFAALNPVNAG